ncbi:MAG: phosphoenolpyruvate carboxykinase (ATP) [Roseiflexaceae bacterium]|jgi:phosphoenolpyruvate carboxykinase (ATP)|nr:phosphoenolpyruvate carboxykinase (ATP) [Chloroflexaceae bacterium]
MTTMVLPHVFLNPTPAVLVEESLRRSDAHLSYTGALVVQTGVFTGRSPGDRYIVADPAIHDLVWWGDINQPIAGHVFDDLEQRMRAHLAAHDTFVLQASVNADPVYAYNIELVSESPWHVLFAQNLFRRTVHATSDIITILHAPSFTANPTTDTTHSGVFIIVNIVKRMVLIGGTAYAGEIKKAVFSLLNVLLPQRDVLPMHAGVNVGHDGQTAVFFGLSGTGKTTLSTDPDRPMIGDDEHGWSRAGIFNFEGGCYAKTIRLSPVGEPEIFAASQQFGTVLENVVLDAQTQMPDFDDMSLTENGRAAYPINMLTNVEPTGMGGHPRHIIMLTADAFGVLPPISRLTTPQAMYHFLSGYTAKVAGTERGVKAPIATFSACFGAPFMVLHPARYAELLRARLDTHHATVWLVNTGWSGGAYGVGQRMPLAQTRAMISAALHGALDDVGYQHDPVFGLAMPTTCPGVDYRRLDPRTAWGDAHAWYAAACDLAARFHANFALLAHTAASDVIAGGPRHTA